MFLLLYFDYEKVQLEGGDIFLLLISQDLESRMWVLFFVSSKSSVNIVLNSD